MLFNSYGFIFVFLPVTLAVFSLASAWGKRTLALGWLVAASLFFYGWWNPRYVPLIVGSVVANYAFGRLIRRAGSRRGRRGLLALGVAANLGALGYFKYTHLVLDTLNAVAGLDVHVAPIVLPLAISFFTFQQVAYLADAGAGGTQERGFINYCAFVTFFPQLIAGPIVHHAEMMPQFERKIGQRLRMDHLSAGITVFVIGLFKKVVIADSIAVYSNVVFDGALNGVTLTLFEAWVGAFAYAFQLYFDFSGYSDMAIGLGRMFGVRIPLNFSSPYKATDILTFWRGWHMTLSRFLRDYLYIPLGGSRQGLVRCFFSVLVTMLLGGLWHGAGWNFVLWGGLHGLFMIVNHAWRAWRRAQDREGAGAGAARRSLARLATFLAVVVAWVFFRAETLPAAASMVRSMFGLNGLSLPGRLGGLLAARVPWLDAHGIDFTGVFRNRLGDLPGALPWIALLWIVAWCLPNTQQFMGSYSPGLDEHADPPPPPSWMPGWRPTVGWGVVIGIVGALAVLHLTRVSEFLYFQF